MYSGSTLTNFSGGIIGAHQKIDRVARRHLARLTSDSVPFPTTRSILRFEGKNGPDGIKRKSPAQNEPWHYYSPFRGEGSLLVELIQDHYLSLVGHLVKDNQENIAFEAAWLAHALVDGLTPAHHYPYEKELTKLRSGESIHTRTTLKKKLLLPGRTHRELLRNNWKMWGPKGLMTTHGLFEIGIAMTIAPLPLNHAYPTQEDVTDFKQLGYLEWFKRTAQEIAALEMYDVYYQTGWTPKLARQVRRQLAPSIIKTVTLTWLAACAEAGLVAESEGI